MAWVTYSFFTKPGAGRYTLLYFTLEAVGEAMPLDFERPFIGSEGLYCLPPL